MIKKSLPLFFLFLIELVGFGQTHCVKPITYEKYSPDTYFENLPKSFKKITIVSKYQSLFGDLLEDKTSIEYNTNGRVIRIEYETDDRIETSRYFYKEKSNWSQLDLETRYKNFDDINNETIFRELILDEKNRLKIISYSTGYKIKYSYNLKGLVDTIFYEDKKKSCYVYDEKNRVISHYESSLSYDQIFNYTYLENEILLDFELITVFEGVSDTTRTQSVEYFNKDTLVTKQIITHIDFQNNLIENIISKTYKNKKIIMISEKSPENEFSETINYIYDNLGNLKSEVRTNSKTGNITLESSYNYENF